MIQSAPHAHTLSTDEVQQYWEQGFLSFPNIFTAGEVEELRAAEHSDEIQNELHKAGIASRTVHLLELTRHHPAFLKLARDPRIVRRIAPLLGPDIQLQHSKLATKPVTKGVGAFGWHQDLAYYPHSNTSLLSVFVYLDDTSPDNGGMSMVPASHKLGMLNHWDDSGRFTGQCQESVYWEKPDANVIPVNCPAGSISIHHCLTLHGSPANRSGHPRRGLVFSYRADDAYQFGDTVFADTGLIVHGQHRGLVRCEAATIRLPRRGEAGSYQYGSAYRQTGDWAQERNQPTCDAPC